MTDILNGSTAVLIIAGSAVIFIVIFFVMFFIQTKSNRRTLEGTVREILISQEDLFNNAAKLLAKKLSDFTENILIEKINDYYKTLVSEELLPSVNRAAEVITELAEKTNKKQDHEIKELATKFTDLIANRTDAYIRSQAEIISHLNNVTTSFADELAKITLSIKEIGALQNNAYQNSEHLSNSVTGAVGELCEKVKTLEDLYMGTTRAIGDLQNNISESAAIVKEMSQYTQTSHQNALNTSNQIAEYSENIAKLLNDSVKSMQSNTETAANIVIDNFASKISGNFESIDSTVTELKGISENISKSADNFSEGISKVYADFGGKIGSELSSITTSISETINSEYQKITRSAETYSQTFSENVTVLGSQFSTNITELKSATEQLDVRIKQLTEDINKSSSRFETGIDKTVSDALNEMDTALAEIVKRLVSVTVSIQEAGDSITRNR